MRLEERLRITDLFSNWFTGSIFFLWFCLWRKHHYLSSVCMFFVGVGHHDGMTCSWPQNKTTFVFSTDADWEFIVVRGLNARKAVILRSRTEQNKPPFHMVNAVIVKYILLSIWQKNTQLILSLRGLQSRPLYIGFLLTGRIFAKCNLIRRVALGFQPPIFFQSLP